MLSTSKRVLLPGHNHLLTTGADDPTLCLSPKRQLTFKYGCHLGLMQTQHICTILISLYTLHVAPVTLC